MCEVAFRFDEQIMNEAFSQFERVFPSWLVRKQFIHSALIPRLSGREFEILLMQCYCHTINIDIWNVISVTNNTRKLTRYLSLYIFSWHLRTMETGLNNKNVCFLTQIKYFIRNKLDDLVFLFLKSPKIIYTID